jgi:hypothetical protein
VLNELCESCERSDESVQSTERNILKIYKKIRDEQGLAASKKVSSDLSQSMMSDLSEASNCSSSGHEKFYARWEPMLYRPDDHPCYLNQRASWMLP